MPINQQITSAPPAPQRNDPNTFADKADAFVAWLENLDDELNQWASECNSTEENINDSEQTVLQAKSDTLAARDQAVAEANAKVYDDSETYNYPDCVIGSDGHVYRCMENNITGEDPVTSTSGNWKRLSVALNSNKQLELPFAQTPILVNGQDMMYRTFYVDAKNGDDNNDGSESAPFKTIKKACDSVPVGGYGVIYIPRGQTLYINSDILLHQKIIMIEPYGSGDNPVIVFDTYVDTNYSIPDHPQNNFSYSFMLKNSYLKFSYCVLQNASKANSSLDWGNEFGRRLPIVCDETAPFRLSFAFCTINQTRDYFIGSWNSFINFMTTTTTFNFSEDAVALITAVDGGGLLSIRQATVTTGYKWIDPGTIGSNVITNLSSIDT